MKEKKAMFRKVISLNLLVLLCMPVVAQNNDTLYFGYEQDTKKLTIEVKRNKTHTDNLAFPFIKQGDGFEKEIISSTEGDGSVFPLDNNNWIQINSNLIVIDNATWFDTNQCKKIKAYMVNSNNLERGFGDIPKQPSCVIRWGVVVPEHSDAQEIDTAKTSFVVNESDKLQDHVTPLLIIILAIVVVGATLIILLIRHNQKKQKNTQPMRSKDASVEVMEVVEDSLANGLDAVKENIRDYFVMDMQQDFADTAVHKIYLHHTAVKKMYDFFKTALESSDQTTETGCYFIGCWEYATDDKRTYNISVEDIVEPGDDIVSGEFSFNFGLKIGVKLFSKISELTKRTNRDFVHTVWMHSHPGLGLFLSSHDLLVQQQLTYSDAPKRLVAFVIDTNTPEWDMAVFTTKNDGTMNNKDELRRLYSLETLYKWSREAHASTGNNHEVVNTVVAEQKNKEDYYPLQVNNQGNTKTSNAFFSGKAINAIDDILYNCAGKATIGGYVEGTCDNHGTIWIENCTIEPVQDALGIIVVDAKVTDQSIAVEYVKDLPVLCVLVCRSDDELLVLTRNNTQEPFTPLADSKANPMTQIKEWLRRRRIYK